MIVVSPTCSPHRAYATTRWLAIEIGRGRRGGGLRSGVIGEPMLLSLVSLAACTGSSSPTTPTPSPTGETPAATGTPTLTGTGNDTGSTGTTSDTGTPTDTPTGDTGTMGGPGGPPALPFALTTPGCPTPFAPTPVDIAGCTSVAATSGGIYNSSWIASTSTTYDALGRPVREEYWDYYGDFVFTWTYDPVTGDVTRTTQNQNDGEYLELYRYTYVRDGQDRVIEMQTERTSQWQFSAPQTSSWTTTYTWGPCGVESISGGHTIEYFLEGTRDLYDTNGDGLPEYTYEQLVDPTTGFPVAWTQLRGTQTSYVSIDDRDPTTGWLLSRDRWTDDLTATTTWTYDAEGHAVHSEDAVDDWAYAYYYHQQYTWIVDTTWTCP